MKALPHIGDVVCAIIERNGRFLIARRPEGKTFALKWEFPGGKVESGESPQDALHRELAEELGVVVEILQQLTPVFYSYSDFSLQLIPYRCLILSGEPVPVEHAALEWISVDGAAFYDFPEADAPILEEYRMLVGSESF
ncbi:MAG: (deoxy)nucleoside triphosphate pyrophosphohydrolase [Chlorobiaceae bacterium]|nr:(deoxy)nucleoside triphosphate pyrophosphohydrolase [Chlorobiaceae bacterium]